MDLSRTQLQQIHKFVRKNLTQGDFYDIQVELIDHFACVIEEKLEESPDLNIDVAIEEVYASFAPYYFNRIFQERTRTIMKESTRNWFRGFLRWFLFPRIFITVGIFLSLWFLCCQIPFTYIAISLSALFFIIAVYYRKKWNYKSFLKFAQVVYTPFTSVFFGLILINLGGIFLPVILFNDSFSYKILSDSGAIIGAIFLCLQILVLLTHIAVRNRLSFSLRNMYPEAFIGNN